MVGGLGGWVGGVTWEGERGVRLRVRRWGGVV